MIKSEELKALDAQLGGALTDIVTIFEFKGKPVRVAGLRTDSLLSAVPSRHAQLALFPVGDAVVIGQCSKPWGAPHVGDCYAAAT